MIHVTYTVDGVTKTVSFSDNVKGNSASVKFCQKLHDERLNHGWFYKLKKVERLKIEFKAATGKKKNRLESELYFEEKDRNELLYMLGIDSPPSLLKVEIFKDKK